MKNRDFQITSRSFQIPITMDEYDVIDHCERDDINANVREMLEEIPGVYNVDYNGHFGLYIFVSIERDHDNDETLHAISEIINREGSQALYQIWGNDESWTMTTKDAVTGMREKELIEQDAKLILEFPAADYEAASIIYDRTIDEWDE
jgi:hypothetical protein